MVNTGKLSQQTFESGLRLLQRVKLVYILLTTRKRWNYYVFHDYISFSTIESHVKLFDFHFDQIICLESTWITVIQDGKGYAKSIIWTETVFDTKVIDELRRGEHCARSLLKSQCLLHCKH